MNVRKLVAISLLLGSASFGSYSFPNRSIEAHARGTRAASGRPAIRDKWALIIGVDSYADPSMSAVKEAATGALVLEKALNDPFAGQFAPGHVITLTGSAASKSGITKTIDEWLTRKALPDDLILIYVAGKTAQNAAGEPILYTFDTVRKNADNTSINLHQLFAQLHSRTQSAHILGLLDTNRLASDSKSASMPDFKTLANHGVTIMTAADTNQPSLNNGVVGYSLFVHYLTEAIRINNGSLTLNETFEHVHNGVVNDAHKGFAKSQTPTLALPAAMPAANMVVIGVPVKSSIPKPTFNMGHPISRLALDRPELSGPRPGGGMVIFASRQVPVTTPSQFEAPTQAQSPRGHRNRARKRTAAEVADTSEASITKADMRLNVADLDALIAEVPPTAGAGKPATSSASSSTTTTTTTTSTSTTKTGASPEKSVPAAKLEAVSKPLPVPVSEQATTVTETKPAATQESKSAVVTGAKTATAATTAKPTTAATTAKPTTAATTAKPTTAATTAKPTTAATTAKPTTAVTTAKPTTAETGAKAAGAKTASAADDDEDDDDDKPRVQVDFSAYITKMKQDIQAQWHPPKDLQSRRIVVTFTITRDGKIMNGQVIEGTGTPEVDKTALEALKAASPLAPLPPGSPRSIDLKYVFDWKVRQTN